MPLSLSRKVGESIDISPGIRVTVVSIDRGRVILSIDAPLNVKIMRSEVR